MNALQARGKIGAVGVVISSFGQLVVSTGFIPASWFPFFAALQGFGLALLGLDLAFHAKETKDVVTTTAAEAMVARTEIANAASNQTIAVPSSTVPAVEAKIVRLTK